MREYAEVDVAEVHRFQLPGTAQGHGGDEVDEYADGQDDLQPQHGGEGAVKGVSQRAPVLPGHARACQVQGQNDKRHDATCAFADGDFDSTHGVASHRLAYAFEDQNLKENRADKHDGGKQVQGNQQGVTHGSEDSIEV